VDRGEVGFCDDRLSFFNLLYIPHAINRWETKIQSCGHLQRDVRRVELYNNQRSSQSSRSYIAAEPCALCWWQGCVFLLFNHHVVFLKEKLGSEKITKHCRR
jgi:hypothetical protein